MPGSKKTTAKFAGRTGSITTDSLYNSQRETKKAKEITIDSPSKVYGESPIKKTTKTPSSNLFSGKKLSIQPVSSNNIKPSLRTTKNQALKTGASGDRLMLKK